MVHTVNYKTSAHILRNQACDPELKKDFGKPVSGEGTSGGKADISMVEIGHQSSATDPRPVKTTAF